MSFIIDKREVNRDRSAENRQRFLKRINSTIKDQIPDIINNRSLKDMDSAGGDIKINRKTIREPEFRYDEGGNIDRVLPGNDKYVVGDEIFRPRVDSGAGAGRKAGKGVGEDDFIIEISRDEFLKYLFDGLELPDLVATELKKIKRDKRENAGFSVDGSPNRLSITRSYRQSLARRIPIRGNYKREIEELEAQLKDLVDDDSTPMSEQKRELCLALNDRIKLLREKIERIPLFDDMDLRYRAVTHKDDPIAHATMVMIMDNSGSMGMKEKTIARKFFWLLYSFLKREYDTIELVFISHTEVAEELDEEEFFNTSVSGGTVVSSALELTSDIIRERLKGKTNVYIAQVSDGDNDDSDNGTCTELLEDDILPEVRYFAYIQVDSYHIDNDTSYSDYGRGLWKSYTNVAANHKNLQLRRVVEERDIYGVFHELFSAKTAKKK